MQRPRNRRGPRLDRQLVEDVLDVLVHGARGSADGLADLRIGFTLGNTAQNLEFPARQPKLPGRFLGDARNSGRGRVGLEQALEFALRLELMLPLRQGNGNGGAELLLAKGFRQESLDRDLRSSDRTRYSTSPLSTSRTAQRATERTAGTARLSRLPIRSTLRWLVKIVCKA